MCLKYWVKSIDSHSLLFGTELCPQTAMEVGWTASWKRGFPGCLYLSSAHCNLTIGHDQLMCECVWGHGGFELYEVCVCVYAHELVGIWVCTQACGSLYHAWTWCLKPLGIACLAREFLGTTCPPNPMVTGTHSHACFVLLFLVFYGCRGFKLSSSYFQVLIPVPTPQSSGLGYFQWDLLL